MKPPFFGINVAKCNLGKVNLEAMLVSCFPSYSRGGPMPLAGAPRDLYTQLLACSSSQSVVAIACCLRASLCFGFACLLFSACTMTTRRTNNSLAARLDGENSSSDTLLQAESSGPSSLASAANSAPQTSSTVSAPVVAAGVHDPALIAAIVDAVKASLAAEKGPGSSSSNLLGNSDSVEPQAAFGGVPAPSPSLSQQTATFLASGGAFLQQQAISSPSATQGRPNFIVPSFVATFATPRSPILSTSITAGASVPVPLSDSTLAANLPSGPLLQQPFVVGPGFSPIPAKTVSQIVAGKYVDLGDLLSVNIVQTEPESQAFLDGRLVFLPSAKKQRRRIEDIVTWSEAFTIFTLILTSYFPHRWKDLTSYKLLILRTYRQFSGRVWLAYDQAFRQHAAATKLVDWSTMNVQLHNFHAAGASVHSGSGCSLSELPETSVADSSQVICWSWNRGHCSAQFASCRFAHCCSTCAGFHRASECSHRFDKTSSHNRKRRSASPPSMPSSTSKTRR